MSYGYRDKFKTTAADTVNATLTDDDTPADAPPTAPDLAPGSVQYGPPTATVTDGPDFVISRDQIGGLQ